MVALICCAVACLAISGAEPHLVAKVPEGCDAIEGSLRFARDGANCAYVVTKGNKDCPVVGSTICGAFNAVSWPTIDPSGTHTAFRGFDFDSRKRTNVYSVVYDGKVIATDDWIGPIALDPAKSTPAFWIAHGHIQTSYGRPEVGAAVLEWGKYKSAKWQYADDQTPPRFTPDGKSLVTIAARGAGDWNVIVVDDKAKEEKRASGSVWEASIRPGGHEIAYTMVNLVGGTMWMNYSQHFVVVAESLDQRPGKSNSHVYGDDYSSAGSPTYSADGRHIAYKVTHESKMGVAIDDRTDARCNYAFVDEIAFNPDGSETAYVGCVDGKVSTSYGREVLRGAKATGGKWWVVFGKLRNGEYDFARCPVWSPDGTTVAYAAKIGEKWLACAGTKRSELCDDIGCVVWSDDGKCVWYGCRVGNELWWRKLDAG